MRPPRCAECGKIAYASREAAVFAAARSIRRKGWNASMVRAYAEHGAWHLTSQPKRWRAT